MPSPFLTEPVVIVNPGQEVSPHGGTREDWATATRVTAYGFITQRGLVDASSAEVNHSARTLDDSKWGLILRGNPPINLYSRVEYAGETFRVLARPKRVAMRGRVQHVEVSLAPIGEA